VESVTTDSLQPEADALSSHEGGAASREDGAASREGGATGKSAEPVKNEEQATPDAASEQLQGAEMVSPEEEDQIVQEVAETVEEKELEALRDELEKAQAQAAEYLDGWQRARAEFANYKKRVEAERAVLRQTSNEALLLKLLPVVDDFERAFQTLPEDLADVPWVDGIQLILRKLQTILDSENVTPIDAIGQAFDPLLHQAVMQEETTEHPDGHVIEEMQRGYRLGERVLRPSMVKVANNAKEASGE
jgi:molecular chaperone GrpE